MVQALLTVTVAVRSGGRVLALRRATEREVAPGTWELVSGKVEHGETLTQAALRECREETGLRARLMRRPLDVYTAPYGAQVMCVCAFQACLRAPCGSYPSPTLSAEHNAFAWLSAADFAARSPFPRLASLVTRALT